MLVPFSPDVPEEVEAQYPTGPAVDALPVWQESGELSDHRQYVFHFGTMMCPQFASGHCPLHGVGSGNAPHQCFGYHFGSQRRRPLVDAATGQLKYWDVFCDYAAAGQECPCGDLCPFAHTQEEVTYHAARYKTELCGDPDCLGEDACCFAHGEGELRTTAHERYSFWSAFGGGACGVEAVQWSADMSMYDPAIVAAAGPQQLEEGGGHGAAGASYCPQAVEVYKHRFCASYPHVGSCRRGDTCVFAHSREEIRLPLLAPEEEDQRPAALSNDFFMLRFKTHWCPIGVQHDWQTCVYAHNYQDARRHPAIGYGPRPCPHWKRQEASLEYSRRCPLGVRCPFSHGAKEQLYHPDSFKTVTCQDSQSTSCPRGKLCAFWHNRSQQRLRSSAKSEYNYKAPLGEEKVCAHLQQDFLTPPFKLLNSLQASMQTMECDVLLDALQPDEMMCGLCDGPQDVVLQDWSLQVCGPGGAATPTTQATQSPATDSDEAGSAVGSDKPIPVQDEDGLDAVVFGSISEADLAMAAPHEAQSHAWQLQGGSPGDCDPSGAVMGQPWGTQVCFGETLVVPAYIPSSSDSGEPTQMLFYMPLPPQMPQMAMVPVAVPMPAPGPEVTYEVMVPVSAAGEALPLEGACATPHFEEAPAPAHHGFLAAAGAGGAMTTQGAGVTPQFEEAPAPEHCGLVPAAEGAAEAATGSGGGGDDDGECESPAYRRPRALSH